MTIEATKITCEEGNCRGKLVRDVFRSNAQEGLKPNPECQPDFDAFIAGEIELFRDDAQGQGDTRDSVKVGHRLTSPLAWKMAPP